MQTHPIRQPAKKLYNKKLHFLKKSHEIHVCFSAYLNPALCL
ncbi:hypothetical protein SALWKB29_0451 [Snodgrassella communis]|uniref:Uncharacterized protein n=1 Tax=Snodgrassella communis TaxID=2946699 RepID=A0A836MSL2_9NEIS|nr:hypothetical protein SALWKB29_0451 [Snodgrassella communis]